MTPKDFERMINTYYKLKKTKKIKTVGRVIGGSITTIVSAATLGILSPIALKIVLPISAIGAAAAGITSAMTSIAASTAGMASMGPIAGVIGLIGGGISGSLAAGGGL